MDNFCNMNESIALEHNRDIAKTVCAVAEKYIRDNPPCGYEYRAFFPGGFKSLENGAVHINLEEKYEKSLQGDYAYAAAEIYRDSSACGGILITPLGAVTAYLNGKEIYRSHPKEEGTDRPCHVTAPWKKGNNLLVLKIKKLADGYFGAKISGNSPKWAPVIFDFPRQLIKGATGFAYSELVGRDENKKFSFETLKWFPIPGKLPEGEYVRLSSFTVKGKNEVTLRGKTDEILEVCIDKNTLRFKGSFSKTVPIKEGINNIAVRGNYKSFSLSEKLTPPENVMGTKDKFIYVKNGKLPLTAYTTMQRLFIADGEKTYWHTAENAALRPCLKQPLFGKWSYPLGVTLNGLYRGAKLIGRTDITDYVKSHVLGCIRLYDYSVWDKKIYGYPNINQQLLWFEELDDIGSFGSLMLAVADEFEPEDKKIVYKIAKRIAGHIMKKQARREDGTLYRYKKGIYNNLWADDLYMCIPFLLNYFKLTGEEKYINEACRQMLLYKKYLYNEKEMLLSHIYDFNMKSASNMPWGRGNGWAFYSLAEILCTLDKASEYRSRLEAYFNDLSEGYIKNQAESGLFRQLINYPDSYEETSSTAMLLYGFSAACKNGFAFDKEKIRSAADKAANALMSKCIDRYGNVYGVCRGSYCSFDAEYYKNLLWSTNDTHGIGIVITALTEYNKIK